MMDKISHGGMIHSWQKLNKELAVTLILSLPSLGRV